MTEMIVGRDMLMVLFNELFSIGKDSFGVKYPFYDVNLFDFHSDFRIRNVISREKLADIRSEHFPDSSFLMADLPGYGELETSFLSCGALEYANWDEFKKWMNDLVTESRDPRRMTGSLCFAIDTNVLYNRFFSGYLPSKEMDFDMEDVEVAISDHVREEISNRIKYKYRSGNLTKLKKVFSNPQHLHEFPNRNMLLTRKAKLAQKELDAFTRELSAPPVEPSKAPGDKEEMDIEIVKSYRTFGQQCGMNTALITMDQNMADHAKNHRLLYHTLVLPHRPFKGGFVGPWCSLQMFHNLAVLFGVITLSRTGVLIFGEWKGKTSQDYTNERLKLVIDERSTVHDKLVRNLDLCKSIIEI